MNSIKELKQAVADQKFIVWLDPQPIDGNDYVVSYIQDLPSIEDWDEETIITINYNDGQSEAEVTLYELHSVLTVEEFMQQYGSDYESLGELQERESLWDYPITELGYYMDEENDLRDYEENEVPVFILIDNEVRIIERP